MSKSDKEIDKEADDSGVKQVIEEMTCENCMYWRRFTVQPRAGECCFDPPVCGVGDITHGGHFPCTVKTEWCGKHVRSRNETKGKVVNDE